MAKKLLNGINMMPLSNCTVSSPTSGQRLFLADNVDMRVKLSDAGAAAAIGWAKLAIRYAYELAGFRTENLLYRRAAYSSNHYLDFSLRPSVQ